MSLSHLACCLVCLAPWVGLAQSTEESAPPQLPADAPLSEPPASPPLVPASNDAGESPAGEFTPTPQRSGWHPVARVALETVGGAAGGLGALLASVPLSLPFNASIICVLTDNNGDCDPGPTTRGYLVMGFALSAGQTLGVYGAGNLAGGRGQLLPTIGGSVLGTGAALAVFSSAQDSNSVPGMAASALLPPLGAILGYELSAAFGNSGSFSYESPRSRSSFRLMPVMGRSPGGAPMGGMIGQF